MNAMHKKTSGLMWCLAGLGTTAIQTAYAEPGFEPAVVEPILVAQAETPAASGGESWRARGDELLQAGKLEEALQAYRKAEQQGAGDEALTMDIGQIYRQLGRDRDAYWEYYKNRHAKDPELRASACYGMNDLQYAKYKRLPDPYFADLGVYGGWQSIEDAAYLTARGRVGIVQGDTNPTTYYLYAHVGGDNRSGKVGIFPEQYFENVAIFGAGVQKLLLPDLGLRFVAETGWAHDLINLDRDRNRTDTRVGLEMWHEWNTVRFCESTDRHPYRFVMTAWGELMYYSRYDNATTFAADLRPGVRVYESDQGAVDVLGIFGVSFDSKADESFQYGEAGAGVRWTPDHQSPFRITAKAVQTYDSDGPADPNYVVEFEHYWYW
jgi:hypothetical protein